MTAIIDFLFTSDNICIAWKVLKNLLKAVKAAMTCFEEALGDGVLAILRVTLNCGNDGSHKLYESDDEWSKNNSTQVIPHQHLKWFDDGVTKVIFVPVKKVNQNNFTTRF